MDRLAGAEGSLDALGAGMVRVVGLAPEGLASKGQMGHQVGMEIRHAPGGNARIGIPVVSPKRNSWLPYDVRFFSTHSITSI